MAQDKSPHTTQRTRRTFLTAAGATATALIGFSGVGAASDDKYDDKKNDGKTTATRRKGVALATDRNLAKDADRRRTVATKRKTTKRRMMTEAKVLA
jgi:hypothetical protein